MYINSKLIRYIRNGELGEFGNIQLINSSDKGRGNTLQSSGQATERTLKGRSI